MSVVINTAANRIFQEFNTTMLKAFDQAPRVRQAFSIEIPSSSRSTLHAWLSNSAFVREWKGSRVLNEMGTLTWEDINRNFELSWTFQEYQLQDDLSGLVGQAIMQARGYGAKWARHEDSLCATTVQSGTSALCYDGQYFFDTDHPVDPLGITSGTFSNLLTSTALTHANFITALNTMKSYKLPDGSPWVPPGSNVKLMVPTALVQKAQQIVVTPWISAAAYGLAAASAPSDNVLAGTAQVVENQWLNDEPTVWYLVAEVDGMMPIMFQRRQGVETSELGPGSQLYFDRKQYQIGSDARYEASYTYPQLMIRCAA